MVGDHVWDSAASRSFTFGPFPPTAFVVSGDLVSRAWYISQARKESEMNSNPSLTPDISPISEVCFPVMRCLGFWRLLHSSALIFTPSFVGWKVLEFVVSPATDVYFAKYIWTLFHDEAIFCGFSYNVLCITQHQRKQKHLLWHEKKLLFFPYKYLKSRQMFIKYLGSLNIERITVEALFCRDVQF